MKAGFSRKVAVTQSCVILSLCAYTVKTIIPCGYLLTVKPDLSVGALCEKVPEDTVSCLGQPIVVLLSGSVFTLLESWSRGAH